MKGIGRIIFSSIEPSAVWTALLASVLSFLADMQAGASVLMLYLIYCVSSGRYSLKVLSTLGIFTIFGLWTFYRFSGSKLAEVGAEFLLPFFAIMIMVWINPRFMLPRRLTRSLIQLQTKLRLHWLPACLMTATLIALLLGTRLTVYWGMAVILFLLVLAGDVGEEGFALAPGVIMITVYVLLIHLFGWRGLLMLRTEPGSFMAANWASIVVPYLGLTAVRLSRAGRCRTESVKEELYA
ncbi:MAG: hypothetical protein K0R57_4691 [Paenibacillaceae bacterium]|jgi:hypothetical protein|nr:hypothetical protein [Paenibacillaceae bacterium]